VIGMPYSPIIKEVYYVEKIEIIGL
jgi:hypothetical protein